MDFTKHIKHLADQVVHHKKKHEHLQGKFEGIVEGTFRVAEVGAGAWLGGVLEGKTAQRTFFHMPLNLLVGIGLAGVGAVGYAGDWSPHLSNLGEGFVASWAASAGYSFGKKWNETGNLFGAIKAQVPLPPPMPVPPPVVQAAAAGDPYAMGQMAAAMGR